MIKIDLTWAMALFFLFTILIVFGEWIFYNCNVDEKQMDIEKMKQCPFCTYIFYVYKKNEEVVMCPRCKSYLEAPLLERPK